MTTRSVTQASFTLERTYPAGVARVWKALSDPASKKKWFEPPETWERDEHTMDFRAGGRETSVGGPKGGPVIKFEALYYDIVPHERIVYSYDMLVDDARISVSLATFQLQADGEGTRLTLTEHGAYLDGSDDGSERKRGTGGLLDKLGAYLAREMAN
jgi:uncharacterized protein YndB with AHSA1/START domain